MNSFDNFILAEKPFVKALRSLETYALLCNNLHGKLVTLLELPITFDESFKVTSVSHFFIDIMLKQNKIRILLQFLVRNLKRFLLLPQ